eukprot:scaffold330_cov246-Pinguiococcus_pyrenoidosus.AAC.21
MPGRQLCTKKLEFVVFETAPLVFGISRLCVELLAPFSDMRFSPKATAYALPFCVDKQTPRTKIQDDMVRDFLAREQQRLRRLAKHLKHLKVRGQPCCGPLLGRFATS